MVKWSPLLPFTPDKLRCDEDEETKREFYFIFEPGGAYCKAPIVVMHSRAEAHCSIAASGRGLLAVTRSRGTQPNFSDVLHLAVKVHIAFWSYKICLSLVYFGEVPRGNFVM